MPSIAPLLLAVVAAAALTVTAVTAATVPTPTDDIIIAAPGSYLPLFGPGEPSENPTYAAFARTDNETMAGMLAAFRVVNEAGGISHAGRKIRAVPVETYGAFSTFVANRTASEGAYWAAYGNVTTAIARPGIVANGGWVARGTPAGVPVVGAVTSTPSYFSAGHRTSLHIRTSAASEMLHLMNYAVHSHLHLQRFLILYSPIPGGKESAAIVAAAIRRMNVAEPIVVPTVLARNTTHFPAWNASLPTLLDRFDPVPQGIVLRVDVATAKLIIEVFSKSRHFKQGHMFFFTTTINGETRYADSTNSSAVFQNLFLSMSFPFPSDTNYAAVQAYQRDVVAWRGALTAAGSTQGTAFERDLAAHTSAGWSMFAMDGYLVGRAIAATLRRMDPANVSGAAFTDAFFETRMFALDDLVFGPFSDGCVGQQTDDTGACWCNSGARRQYVVGFSPETGRGVPVSDNADLFEKNFATTPIPLSDCAFDEARLREPMIVTAVRDPDFVATTFATAELETPRAMSYAAPDPAAAPRLAGTLQEAGPRRALPAANVTAAHGALVRGALRVLTAANGQGGVTRGSMYTVAHEMAGPTAASLAAGEAGRYKLFAAAFPLARPMALAGRPLLTLAPLRPDLRFLDRDPDTVPAADHDPNVLQVLPAMADLLHTAAAFASERGMAGDVAAVVDSANLLRLARLSVESFGRRMRPSAIVHTDAVVDPVAATSEARAAQEWAAAKAADSAAPAAPTAADVQRRFLAVASPSADPPRVVIVATHEPSVVDAVLGAAGSVPAATVVVCTSELLLSNVTSAVRAPPLNVLFASGLPGSSGLTGPLHAYGAFVGRILLAAHRSQDKSTAPAEVAAEAFKRTSLQYEGASATHLSNEPCAGLTTSVYPHPGGACQCSKAVNAFSLFNHTAASVGKGALVTDYEQVPTFTFTHSGCGVAYTAIAEPPSDPLLTGTEIALTAAGGVVALVLAGFIGLLVYRHCRESWAARHAPTDQNAPFAMVFTDIQASTVLWARYPEQMGRGIDVHHATLRDLISRHKGYEVKTIGDSFMVAFKDVDDAARFALTSQSALHDAPWETTAFDDVYDKLLSEQHPDLSKAVSNGTSHGLWRGIRVRLGVHYGTGRIIIDETTKHRDYYGTVVNVAARVEGVGHGGQVLLTGDTMAALHPDTMPPDASILDFGPQPLRGLSTPVSLHQVLPRAFADRQFPPLRLDVEVDVGDESHDSSGRSESARSAGKNTEGSQGREAACESTTGASTDASRPPTTAVDGARSLLSRMVRAPGRVTLPQLLLADRTLATLLATEPMAGREVIVKRWAERWRLPRLRRRDQMHFSLMPADELVRLRVAMRVVESMAATGTLEGASEQASEAGPYPGTGDINSVSRVHVF